MESVIWAFKQLWDKGLAYEGNRVLPYCWNDETPLSSHELRMDDDVYQSRQDPAITVGFRVDGGDDSSAGAYLLIWTTTPWTLPSNQAVAVNPEVDYVQVAGPRRPALRPGAGPAGGLRPRARGGARGPGHLHRAGICSGCATCRRSRISWTRPTLSGAARRLRHHRGRHRHRAHVAGLRRGRHGDHRRRRASSPSRRSTPRAASTRPCRTTPASTCSTPTRRSSAT